MSKVMSLHDAIAKYVESGDSLCFGGFTTNRKPYAAVYEIIRQGQTDFIGYSGPAGGDWDMLIGCGRIKAFINCYIANSGYTNVCRRFRDAVEKKHNFIIRRLFSRRYYVNVTCFFIRITIFTSKINGR